MSEDRPAETCDVFVLGGGPGGSAVATLLAEAGLRVVIAEKERHPRFHVGESLLPHSMPILKRLGVLDQVGGIGVEKPGAEFISEDGSVNTVFAFTRALTPGPATAFQVRRQDFDALLFRRAADAGAETLEETTARVISCNDGGAVIETNSESTGSDGAVSGDVRLFQAGLLIDASGRSTLMAKARREKTPDPRNTSAAIFGHFRNVPRREGARGGNIRIHLTDPGWMWQIPLQEGITSIGLVAPGAHMAGRKTGIEAFFRAHAARHPDIAGLLAQSEPVGQMHATGNFSYRAASAHGPGHLKVGDAYGFIDPVFSTGVHLALNSACEAADAVLATRGDPVLRARRFAAYDRHIRRRIDYVSWFIYRIHDPAFREMMLHPRDILGIERAVISLLAGDFRRDLRIQSRIWLFKALRHLVEFRQSRGITASEAVHA
ncbi:MAG: NAD(P)/FAD-dependent oxidoreductase [Pseudomonadota bacterium]